MSNRRAVALQLSDELLADFEWTRLPPIALVRKTSRLARLLDDLEAVSWLSFEQSGYQDKATGQVNSVATAAAMRSGRCFYDEARKENLVHTDSLGQLQANGEGAKAQLAAAADAPVSITSANPHQIVTAPSGNARERVQLVKIMTKNQALVEEILGAIHGYVSQKELELRFGAAVETAFSQVRATVDSKIADLVPDAAVKLSAAFENAASDNAEDWASSAATCRRLIKAVADALRPPGDDVAGRKMGEDQYINRLVDWIATSSTAGSTARDVVKRDLEYLGSSLPAT